MLGDETPTLESLHLEPWYTSGRANLIRDFYVPCLSRASQYDRAVGFFSSSLYAAVSVALSQFIERGGRIRLVCSPHLSQNDIEAIERGLSLREQIEANLLAEVRSLANDPANIPAVELLATMIGARILDIRVAYRPRKLGIFHSKIGIFATQTAAIGFEGSINESYTGFSEDGNHESFAVFTTWRNDVDNERVAGLRAYFESLWSGQEPRLEVVEFPELPRNELRSYANPGGIEAAVERVRSARVVDRRGLRRTARVSLMSHQTEALANWEDAEHRGIVQHATGAGKTLTGLEAIRRWIYVGRPALVLVPSDLLLSQWTHEIKVHLADINPQLLLVGGSRGSRDWHLVLADFTRAARYLGPRIVVATIQSASTEKFLSSVVAGEHLLVVADEVHRTGSPRHQNIFSVDAGARLGLSATPTRYGDPEGTSAILQYFGEVVQPTFGIPDAIRVGRLVPYDYHVVDVGLTDEEQERWDKLTTQVIRAYARLPETDGVKTPVGTYRALLIRRARILKQATAKVEAARRTVTCRYRSGQRWLVYCDDGTQLRAVLEALRGEGLPVFEYWSGTDSSLPETLAFITRSGGVLVAIRCLDEGVDLPSLDHALILASSSNPREFIQRRGRVLRRAPGKFRAIIYDAMVVPSTIAGPTADRLPILRTELRRASEFSRYAQNRSSHHRLRQMASELGLGALNGFGEDFEEGSIA